MKQRLLSVTTELMSQTRSTAVSLRAVAERAGCDPALVNYYFGGKAGLVSAVLDAAAQEVTERMQPVVHEGTAREQLEAMLVSVVSVMSEQPYLGHLALQQLTQLPDAKSFEFLEQLANHILLPIAKIFDEGSQTGELRSVEPVLVYSLLWTIPLIFNLFNPMLTEIFGEQQVLTDPDRFARGIADVIFQGIAHDRGTQPDASTHPRRPATTDGSQTARARRSRPPDN